MYCYGEIQDKQYDIGNSNKEMYFTCLVSHAVCRIKKLSDGISVCCCHSTHSSYFSRGGNRVSMGAFPGMTFNLSVSLLPI